MYKKPPKHVQTARLVILYSIMTLAVLSIVTLLVMMVANYGYNKATGTFEQRGLVQFASTPSAATIEIDAAALPSKTSTKSSVTPGEHRFAIWREGYETWISNQYIPEGSLVWLNYIRLVPKELPVTTLHTYETFVDALPSPTNRSILVQTDTARPEFRFVTIADDEPKGRLLKLPTSTVSATSQEQKTKTSVTYELDAWDESGRYVTVWRVADKKTKELLVIDTTSPEKSVNVSRTFSIPIGAAEFSGRSGRILYVTVNGSLHKLDIGDGTISRSLISNVAWHAVQDDGTTVAYTTQPDESTGLRTIGVYRDGDESPTVLRTITNESSPVSIASYRYYGDTYTAITEGHDFTLYKGHPDQGLNSLAVVASRTFSSDITSVEFNETGSQLLLRLGDAFASYGIDRRLFSENSLDNAEDLFWLDAMHLGLAEDGALTMRDIDGSNVMTLNTVGASKVPAVLSRKGTYLYSYLPRDDGRVSFQRVRMILP